MASMMFPTREFAGIFNDRPLQFPGIAAGSLMLHCIGEPEIDK
jgi:hypothetical protein